MTATSTFCGYVSLLGRPNAGKSTLLNACIGQKIVGVSKRPQTTRDRILGIKNLPEAQLVFFDTPGLTKGGRLGKILNRSALSTVPDSDLVCYLVSSRVGWTGEDTRFLEMAATHPEVQKIAVVLTQSDRLKKFELGQREIETVRHLNEFRDALDPAVAEKVHPTLLTVSAKVKESIDTFCSTISPFLPEQGRLFPEDEITDKSENFIVQELIREHVFRRVAQEIPFGSSVVIENMEHKPDIVVIQACITVDRPGHKGIIIGKSGKLIKQIGEDARHSLERHFGKKVFLELFVRVLPRTKWEDDLMNQIS